MKTAGWGSSIEVKGKLQAHLYHNRKRRLERANPPADFDPSDLDNYYAHWDFTDGDTITESSAGFIDSVADKSENGLDMTTPGTGNPAWSEENGAVFAGDVQALLKAGTNTDWNFLHDGNGGTIIMVYERTFTPAPSESSSIWQALFSTSSSSGNGMSVFYQNRTAPSTENQFRVYPMLSGVYKQGSRSNGKASNEDKKDVLALRIDSSEYTSPQHFRLDQLGQKCFHYDVDGAYSLPVGNSQHELILGGVSYASLYFIGNIYEAIVFDRTLTDHEIRQVSHHLAVKHGLYTNTFPVHLLIGQSNAGDLGLTVDGLYYEQGQEIFWGLYDNESSASSYKTDELEVYSHIGNSVGCETAFYKNFIDINGSPITLIKYYEGGSSLGGDWSPTGSTWINAKAAINAALVRIKNQGLIPRVDSVMWLQGETDSLDATDRANYQANMEEFMERFRNEIIGAISAEFFSADIIADGGAYSTVNSEIINTAKKAAFTADGNATFIEDPGDWIVTDTVHYDMHTLDDIGTEWALGTTETIPLRTNSGSALVKNDGEVLVEG